MEKEEFITRRTQIIGDMLDNPNDHEIYPTAKCFNELDALFDELSQSQSDAVEFAEWLNDNPTAEFVIVRTLGYSTFKELYKEFLNK